MMAMSLTAMLILGLFGVGAVCILIAILRR